MSNVVDMEDDVNHSLPNAEEAKTEAAIMGMDRKRRNRLVMVAVGLLIVLSIVIGVGVGMSGSKGSTQEASVRNGQTPKVPTTDNDPSRDAPDEKQGGSGETIDAPNSKQDEVVNDGPTLPSGPQDPTRFEEIVAFLSGYSDEGLLVTGGEAQNAVATWMAELDHRQLDVPDDYETDEAYRFMQRYVLALLYRTLDGSNWPDRAKFMTSDPECQWYTGIKAGDEIYRMGVTCDQDGFVTEIFLPANQLKGELVDEIGWMTSLTHLSLYGNELEGELPDLSLLVDMKFLAIESNALTGNIPAWLGGMTSLEYLALGDNQLTGELPVEIADMQSLQEVALDWNNLSGEITVFLDLLQLRRLYLGHNEFIGEIDDSFLVFSDVTELDLASNNFTGYLPAHFFSNNKIEVLDLHSNWINGSLPQDISRNDRLTFLSLYDNYLSNQIPAEITKWEAITHLDLSDNEFTGAIPSSLELMTTLEYLFLSYNEFDEGPMLDLALLTDLMELSLKATSRTGTIPDDLGHLQKLVLLDLDKNSFDGPIPASLGTLANLQYLLLNRNQFNGSIPSSFTGLESIDMLLLYDNALSGDATPICGPEGPGEPSEFVTDCVITCDCCSKCCEANDAECYNDDDLLANIDYEWETGYRRDAYVFSEDIEFRWNSKSQDR